MQRVPPPRGKAEGPSRALIFDSHYDQYRGVVAFVRVVDGDFRRGEVIRLFANGRESEVEEVGFFGPDTQKIDELKAGEVGYIITGIKDVADLRVGDTLTDAARPTAEPLPGYREAVSMVFCGMFPIDGEDYPDLKDALEKLKLNDASLHYEPETSKALGFGFRCGFLGLLHMEIIRERLEREFGLGLLMTTPSVLYQVVMTDGTKVPISNPTDFPDGSRILEVLEPYITANILVPQEFVGSGGVGQREAGYVRRDGVSLHRSRSLGLRSAAGRDRSELLRSAQDQNARLRQLRLRVGGLSPG